MLVPPSSACRIRSRTGARSREPTADAVTNPAAVAATQENLNMSKKSGLSKVPVRLIADTTLPSGRVEYAGHTIWLDRSTAESVEMRRLGTVLAAVSVLRACATPNGTLTVDSAIATVPLGVAERLEAEGAVKILRDDRMIEIHRAAWAACAEEQKRAVAHARQLSREAQEAGKKASSLTAFRPSSIDWDAPLAKAPASAA